MLSKVWDSIVNNRIVWSVCAAFAAFLLWNYVVHEQNPTKTAIIPFNIEYSGEDQIFERHNLKLETGYPEQVSMKVSGTYSDVSKLQSNPVITVDLLTVQTAGEHQIKYVVQYPTAMSSSSLSVTPASGETNIDDDYITLTVVEIKSKSIEVFYDNAITFEVGDEYVYDSSKISWSPNTVTIEGPADIIDQIDRARVSPVELKETLTSTTSIERPIELVLKSSSDESDGEAQILDDTLLSEITMDTETVLVTLPIQSRKTVDLTVDIAYGGGANEDNASYDIEPKYVEIVGDADTLKSINSISIGSIDLPKFEENEFTQEMTINYPAGVEENMLESATVSVKISGAASKQITVTNFSAADVPEGYSYVIETKELEVTVRGPGDVIGSLDANSVRAVANLKDLTTAGTVIRPVTIYIDGDEYSDVGAIYRESNRVTIVLSKD